MSISIGPSSIKLQKDEKILLTLQVKSSIVYYWFAQKALRYIAMMCVVIVIMLPQAPKQSLSQLPQSLLDTFMNRQSLLLIVGALIVSFFILNPLAKNCLYNITNKRLLYKRLLGVTLRKRQVALSDLSTNAQIKQNCLERLFSLYSVVIAKKSIDSASTQTLKRRQCVVLNGLSHDQCQQVVTALTPMVSRLTITAQR